ncbi:hypothetical protein D3C86_1762580 [compost metagenome]
MLHIFAHVLFVIQNAHNGGFELFFRRIFRQVTVGSCLEVHQAVELLVIARKHQNPDPWRLGADGFHHLCGVTTRNIDVQDEQVIGLCLEFLKNFIKIVNVRNC